MPLVCWGLRTAADTELGSYIMGEVVDDNGEVEGVKYARFDHGKPFLRYARNVAPRARS